VNARVFLKLAKVVLFGFLFASISAVAADQQRHATQGNVVYAGATGSIGRIAIGLLRERGYRVRAVSRNPARAARVQGTGYQWVYGDVRDPDDMLRVTRGAEVVVCSISYKEFEGPESPQFIDYMGVRNLVDAAKANHARQFVLVSAGNAGPLRDHRQNPRFGYVAYWKTKGEEYLKKSGVPFTIVGPTGFVDGAADANGIRIAPRTEYRMGTIARADVAAVTVASVDNPDALGKALFIENDPAVKPGSWRGDFAAVKPE
jgi:uncharacterized protein YbjT (DUF2867 family)